MSVRTKKIIWGLAIVLMFIPIALRIAFDGSFENCNPYDYPWLTPLFIIIMFIYGGFAYKRKLKGKQFWKELIVIWLLFSDIDFFMLLTTCGKQ